MTAGRNQSKMTLTVYDMRTEHPIIVSQLSLGVSRDIALEALYAVRSGLPAWCCASLVDARGYNVRPS
jgi:hypothetical protein